MASALVDGTLHLLFSLIAGAKQEKPKIFEMDGPQELQSYIPGMT